MEAIQFDLTVQSFPVVLKNGDGEAKAYELREMTSKARDQFLDTLTARTRLDSAGKPVGLNKFEGLQSDLLCRCMYHENKLVTSAEIQNWPASVVSLLYKKAQEINHLNEEGRGKVAEEIKND